MRGFKNPVIGDFGLGVILPIPGFRKVPVSFPYGDGSGKAAG